MSDKGFSRPQARRNTRRNVAIFLVLITSVMFLADRQQTSFLASGRYSADNVAMQFLGFLASPIRGVGSIGRQYFERSRAHQDNKRLKDEVARLRKYENQVLDLEMRVNRFEEILGMDNSADIPIERIVARAVSETNGPFVHTALINAGINKGVRSGHAVMSVDGLYGHVVRAGRTSSRILLLNDLSSRISVMSQRSQSRAILVGNNSTRPKLDYISADADWRIGDRVVTSGDGGVLPRGLPIGHVDIVDEKNPNVKLFTQGKPVDWVWVLPYKPTPPPQGEGELDPETLVENEAENEVAQP